jgi:hypothetical protein
MDVLGIFNYIMERVADCFNKNRNKEFIKNDKYLDMNNSFEYKLMPQSDDFENEERIENMGDILSRSI